MSTENESPEFQEVEFIVKLRFQLPTNKGGEIIDEEDYCEELRSELIRAFIGKIVCTGNSADAVDILECREEAALYHPTQEQAYQRVREVNIELAARLEDLRETLDM